jgi:PAS domain S-box-containing protein
MSTPGRQLASRVTGAWRTIRELNITLEVPAILRTLVASAMELIEAEGGSAGRVENGKLVFREFNSNGTVRPVHHEYAPGQGIPGRVMETGLPYFTNDPQNDPHATQATVRELGCYNAAVVPILASDHTLLGCFAVQNTVGHRPIDEGDISVLEGLASIAAVAIQNAQMVEHVRRSELNLVASRNSFRLTFAANPVPMFVWDIDSREIIEVNQAGLENYGYTRDELIGMNVMALLHDGDRAEFQNKNNRAPFRGIRCHRRKDGSSIVVDVAGQVIEFEGRPARLSVLKDVTETVEAQQRLMLQHDITQLLAQSRDLDSAAEGVLRAFCLYMNWSLGTICMPSSSDKGLRCRYQWRADDVAIDLIGQSSVSGSACACRSAWTESRPTWVTLGSCENQCQQPSCLGSALSGGMQTTLAVPMALQGKTLGLLQFFSREPRPQDERLMALTAQIASELGQFIKRARAEEEHALLIRAVEQTGESIVITDADARILYVNPAFERISGYEAKAVLGKNPRIIKSGKQPAEFYADLWIKLTRGETWSGKFLNRSKSGRIYEEEATISPVRDASGKVVNFVSVKRDVSVERQLEEQLRQSQKMEAIGQLAGGVAHDFNNMLGVIIGYSELLLERNDSDERSYKAAEEIRTAAERAAALTRQLLAFSRKQVLEPRLLDLNVVVTNLVKMLHRLIGESVELVILPGEGIGTVKADPGQVEQVILNLAVNARDAMPQGGRLVIETSNVAMGANDIDIDKSLEPGRYVLLTIADSGHGMPPEIRDRIFEPFFTTKEAGKGTGLGLSTVYGIIRQSGGYIFADSTPGRGTVFSIYLPRVEGAAAEIAAKPSGPMPRGTETLLLVEDESAARMLMSRLLRDQGYTVLEAENGLEALKVTEEYKKNEIHLVITDIVMPKMGGRELATILSQTHPKTKVLFISGYDGDPDYFPVERYELLQKPFHVRELGHKIRTMLDE